MNVPGLQAEALSNIAALRSAREVLAIIPAYIGPWAVAALDAARFLADNPGEQALLVYEHDNSLERFADYIAPLVGNATIANSATVAAGHADHAYVALSESSWQRVRGAVSPRFVLRHSPAAIANPDIGSIVTAPSYLQADGRRLEWGPSDSIRYYSELYFDRGGPVSGETIVQLARAGEGPYKLRLFRDIGGLEALREAAGLGDDVIYHRGTSVQQRADLLRRIGEGLGYTPSALEIKRILREMNGPSYDTLIKDVGLPGLRQLAGQDPDNRREAARRAAVADWTAAESASLYRQLSQNAGKSGGLTRHELEKALAQLPQLRRPNIVEMLAPFATTDQEDDEYPFNRMRDAADLP